MASANLDLQDLNALLTSYTKEYRELEKIHWRFKSSYSTNKPNSIERGA